MNGGATTIDVYETIHVSGLKTMYLCDGAGQSRSHASFPAKWRGFNWTDQSDGASLLDFVSIQRCGCPKQEQRDSEN